MRNALSHLVLLASLFAVPAAAELPVVDDCTEAMYLDRTAAGADRVFRWDYSFASDPERCIKIRAGWSVQWEGNFGDHPLEGDQGDRPNPIDGHVAGLVKFDRPGVFGYRCNFHLEMRGAVWVVPATPPSVPAGGGFVWLLTAALLALLGFLGAGRVGAMRG